MESPGARTRSAYYVFVFVAVLLVASLAAVHFAASSPGESRSTNYPEGAPVVVHSPIDNSLELAATIRQAYLGEGQNLTVIAEVNNTSPDPLKVNSTSMDNPAYGPCDQGFATGIQVYAGHYSLTDLTEAQGLLLYNPSSTYFCPAIFTFYYTFSPNSANATMAPYLNGFAPENETRLVRETSVVGGYWIGSGQAYAFRRFDPGQYTVLVFDAWGNKVIGYFQQNVTQTTSYRGVPIEGVFTPCYDGPFSLDTSLNSSSGTIKALQLDPGTTGYICLDYQFPGGAPAAFQPDIGLAETTDTASSFSVLNCMAENGTKSFGCPGMHLSFEILPGTTTVGVNITVDSTANQGIYWLWIGQPCSPTVLYVGQPPSEISREEAGGYLSCITGLSSPSVQVVGILGFRITTLNVAS